MKFYRYKQLQRLTFFGYDDIYKTDMSSLYKKSPQSRTVEIPAVAPIAAVAYNGAVVPIVYAEAAIEAEPAVPPVDFDTKIMRFNLNNLHNTQLSQNAKIVIEQIYLPLLTLPEGRSGPITVRMNNLNTNSHDSQNNGFSSTLLYVMDQPEAQHALTFHNSYPEMLYNFSIPQNFFQNEFVEFQITYPNIDVVQDSLNRFYISLVVYDIDEQDLLLKDTSDVDFKNFAPHVNFHNGRVPKA